MRQVGGKRHKGSRLRNNVERIRPIKAERTTRRVLARAREKHHDRDAPRELVTGIGEDVMMSSIESAGQVAEKAGTLVARQRDTEELRHTLTNACDRTLDLRRGCGIDLHFQCPARISIDDEPVGVDFGRCGFTMVHRGSDALAPLAVAKVRKDERSRVHVGIVRWARLQCQTYPSRTRCASPTTSFFVSSMERP